jgi:magnesium transporter
MNTQITFYYSQVSGLKIFSENGVYIGRVKDLLVDVSRPRDPLEPVRPKLTAIKVRNEGQDHIYNFEGFSFRKVNRQHGIICRPELEIPDWPLVNSLWLGENILDKQIIDINGRKVVRVNDIRLVQIAAGTYSIAVDVGIEGLLRRIGIERPVKWLLNPFSGEVPDKYILWDDIEAIDFTNASIRLSTASSKLNRLHPSDLADIFEDLDVVARHSLFESLDEEKAADVLEELEPNAQVDIVESLPVEKVADLLEKMPADEVADILDVVEEKRAESLLREMDKESSDEVRELLEYPETRVGSLMTTDYYTFLQSKSVGETLEEIRKLKPEPAHIYAIFIVDRYDHFRSVMTLGELVVADPAATLKSIMKKDPVSVFDDDRIDILADLVSKYNLLAVPVINQDREMEGVVVIEDIVDDLLRKRKTL